jgi:inosine/xanthosine triphosphatase
MINVIVGSTNPIKINAVKLGFQSIFKDENINVKGIVAHSGVSDQPTSDEETFIGASNRAKQCKHAEVGDYFVGIEGGVDDSVNGMVAFAWVSIHSGKKVGQSRTSTFELPAAIVDHIRNGIELGKADDLVFGTVNSKQKGGAVGLLTHGALDRTNYYAQAVTLALIPFINQNLY